MASRTTPPSPALHAAQQPDDTRERLINAAGPEFARRGYFASSIRTICAAAGANVSAVKYHFGSKRELYRAVVEVGRGQMCGGEGLPIMAETDAPEVALERWMRWFLRMLLEQEAKHPWIGEILAHEMLEPTECLDEFVAHTAGPMHAEVRRVVRAFVGDSVDDLTVGRLANALIVLCASHRHSRHMLARIGFPSPTTPEEIAALAALLARFATTGLRGFAREGTR
jgi:AcrR family transcriptional regulator